MNLALFDLDNTLLAGDSDVAWNDFIGRKGVVDAVAHSQQNAQYYQDYQNGTLDIQAFLGFCLAPFARLTAPELAALLAEFLHEEILPMITLAARAEIARHQAEGAVVAIITATNRIVTTPIAAELGVAHLIATEAEFVDGRYTGRALGTPCFQAGKIVCLDAWLAKENLGWTDFAQTWFYSDSRNDIPLLERVSHPVAVNADPTLHAHALAQGWRTLNLRGEG